MNNREFLVQNKTMITALHMIIWAVLSGVSIVIIIIMELFTWPFIIAAMVGTFIISFPISWAIVRGMLGTGRNKNH